jgi:hypothetical protein
MREKNAHLNNKRERERERDLKTQREGVRIGNKS